MGRPRSRSGRTRRRWGRFRTARDRIALALGAAGGPRVTHRKPIRAVALRQLERGSISLALMFAGALVSGLSAPARAEGEPPFLLLVVADRDDDDGDGRADGEQTRLPAAAQTDAVAV